MSRKFKNSLKIKGIKPNPKHIPEFRCIPRPFKGSNREQLFGHMFWCPYCESWHVHGVGDGHRVAHCTERSPFENKGYIVTFFSDKELRAIVKAINEYLDFKRK